MRHIKRINKPDILVRKEQEWTQNFIHSDKTRPDSSKYGHREIRESLIAMSFHKCFFCETKLAIAQSEVDHFVEVAEKKELAFEWDNLYLACNECNRKKLDNSAIPVADTLDPCKHTDTEIKKHLTFEDEIIRINNESEIGFRTIQKYKLDRNTLNYHKLRHLSQFKDVVISIQRKMHQHSRPINDFEKQQLKRFAQQDNPFSLMFENLLSKYNIK